MNKKTVKSLFSSALLASVLVPTSVSFAATTTTNSEKLPEYSLNPVVVTATRSNKEDLNVPASTTILTTAELKATGAENMQEALGMVNGIVYKTFAPGGGAMGTMINEVTIRGLTDSTLILVNGTPINLRGKYFLDAIPIDAVKKVEIIKGGSSVLYGSRATAGVINIITKKDFKNSIKVGIGNYGQKNYQIQTNVDKLNVGFNKEYWGAVKGIGRNHNKEGNNKSTDLVNSNKDNLTVNYNFDEHLTFNYNYYKTNVQYDTWYDNIYKKVPAAHTLQQNRTYMSKQNLAQFLYSNKDFKGNLYYNQNEITAFGYTNFTTSGLKKNKIYDTVEKNRTYGFDLNNKWTFKNDNNLILGTSYHNEFYDDKGADNHLKKRKLYSRNIYSLYGQYNHHFDQKNEAIIGARETWTAGANGHQNYSNLSTSWAYLHKIDKNQSLYANVSQSFIMPTFGEMYGASDSAISNPGLKPQKGLSSEIGWKKLHNNHQWKVALYKINLKDKISPKWEKNHYQYTNEEFKNFGISLTSKIKVKDGLSYNWGVDYGDPKVKSTKKPYWDRQFGKLQLTGGVTYNKDKWTTSIQGSYLTSRVEAPSSTHSFKTKPYFLTNLSSSYRADKYSTFTLNVNNLLNRKDNLSHSGTEYYSTPRNFILSYQHMF